MSGCAEPTKPAGLRPQSQSRTAQTAGPHVKSLSVCPSVKPSVLSRRQDVRRTTKSQQLVIQFNVASVSRQCHVGVTSGSASRQRHIRVTSTLRRRHVGVTSVSRRCHVDVIVTRLPYQSLPVSATSARAEHVRWARAFPTYPQSTPSLSVWVACGGVTC